MFSMMQNVIFQQLDLLEVATEWVTSVNLILQEVKTWPQKYKPGQLFLSPPHR